MDRNGTTGPSYDPQLCELFTWHLGEVLKTCAKVEAREGPAYGAEYRRRIAEIILTGVNPTDAPERRPTNDPLASAAALPR